jgi:flagellar biosynthesis/type III secretory pathway M-ring protein FliF/YscJ
MGAIAGEMPGPTATRLSAERIAEDDPERVAQQIRTWMQED